MGFLDRCSQICSKITFCSISLISFGQGMSRDQTMSLVAWAKKELTKLGVFKSKKRLLPQSSLASVESLSVPLVQEVVLSADLGCANCQKRVSLAISRMDMVADSMVVDILEKKVTLTSVSSIRGLKQQVGNIHSNPHRMIVQHIY